MERGQLILVDGRPAEFVEYVDEIDGLFVTYRSLRDGREHWLSMTGSVVRMRHVPKHRS